MCVCVCVRRMLGKLLLLDYCVTLFWPVSESPARLYCWKKLLVCQYNSSRWIKRLFPSSADIRVRVFLLPSLLLSFQLSVFLSLHAALSFLLHFPPPLHLLFPSSFVFSLFIHHDPSSSTPATLLCLVSLRSLFSFTFLFSLLSLSVYLSIYFSLFS